MKMKKEHFDEIKSRIGKLFLTNKHLVDLYESAEFPQAEKIKDLQTRFNFDIFYYVTPGKWVSDNLYPYLDDSNINTALNQILPKLDEKKFQKNLMNKNSG